jgi:hypothetical protein
MRSSPRPVNGYELCHLIRVAEVVALVLLKKLSVLGIDEYCNRLVFDTAATNMNAGRFYKREGLVDTVNDFVKPLRSFA